MDADNRPLRAAGPNRGNDGPCNSKYLLLDRRIVQQTEGVTLVIGEVRKHPSPLFRGDKPWEVRYDNLYANVIFDDQQQIYKCWYRPGIVVTRPFEPAGSRLEVNADARGGSLAVEVLDEQGRALTGLSRAKCKPLENVDGFRLQLTWNKLPGFAALQGKLVRLNFTLQNAKLYAFQVRL